MAYKPRHEAPTNRRCHSTWWSGDRLVRCLRYEGHPQNLYGKYGHRAMIRNDEFIYITRRATLAAGIGSCKVD
jgi:hypothetical protein